MYLRAAKTETEEAGESTEGMANSVSELRGEIFALTGQRVDIQIDDDTFKSTYQILKELSEVWDDLTDVSRANITELIGGKRNSNVISSLLKNFSVAKKALETSANSSGSALAENEKFLDSIEGRIQQFKATFQDLSQSLIDSESVKQIVDLGTGLLNVLGVLGNVVEALGGLNSILLMVGGSIAILKFDSFLSWLDKISNTISLAKTAVQAFGLQVKETFAASQAAGMGKFKSALSGIKAGFDEVSISASTAQIAVAAFVACIAIINLVKSSIENARQAVIQEAEAEIASASAVTEKADALSAAFAEYSKYAEIANRTPEEELNFQNALKQVTEAIGDKTTALKGLKKGTDEYTEALKTQISTELQDAENKAKQARKAAADKLEATAYSAWSGSQIDFTYTNSARRDDEKVKKIVNSTMSDKFKTSKHHSKRGTGYTSYKLDAGDKTNDEIVQYYYELIELKDRLTKADLMETSAYDGATEAISTLSSAVEDYVNAKYDEAAAVYKNENGIPSTIEEYNKYRESLINTLSDDFGLSGDVVTSLVDGQLEAEGLADKFADVADNAVKSFQNTLKEVYSLSDGLDELDKIYADVFDKEDFDWSSILDNETFKEEFDELGDVYDNFIKTIANSPSDINACQDAFNKLATAYILNSDALKEVTADTRDATVAMLEQKGIANAAALVDEQLAINKSKVSYETQLQADATVSDILALYDEETASRIDAQALYELAIAKMQTNENALLTSSDIAQLEALADAAGATTESLLNVSKAKAYIAKAEELEAKKAELIKGGADPRGISVVSTNAYNYRLWAEELLNKKITYDVDFRTATYTGGSSTKSAQKSAASAAEKAAKEEETWFERQLKDHQHLVAMEQETEADYLNWLNKAYKQAYSEGIIELDDYYKYSEEVFEGLRDLFKDGLSDVEHEISMRENYKGEEKKIISLYQGLIKDVEKEIANARAQGLTDEDDYIQELQDKWQDYTNSVKEIREEIEDAAKDALDDLIDYRVDMLKQEIEDEKDALDEKLDNLKEFYDKQKEMLQDKYDEEKYLEDQAEKRKSVSDIKSELSMLENDDSAWAQKRKLELQEELTDAEKDLADFEKENALDKALDAIDEAYNSQEAQLQREMEALDEKLNDPNALFNQALEDIKNNSKNQLYYQMLMYNRQYGDGNDATVESLWTEAFGALNDYQKLFGKSYQGVSLKNETGVKEEGGWDSAKVSGTNPSTAKTTTTSTSSNTKSQSSSPSLSKGSNITVKKTATNFSSKSGNKKIASFVPGGSYTVYQTSGDQVLIGRNGVYTGWIKKTDIVGYASGTKRATAGLHELYEQGDEYVFSASDGSRYRMFSGGEKVLNAKATEFLYDFANSGGDVLAQMLKNVFGGTGLDGITPTVINNEINMGNIIIEGNANQHTVSEIRREQREAVSYMLHEFSKLNK